MKDTRVSFVIAIFVTLFSFSYAYHANHKIQYINFVITPEKAVIEEKKQQDVTEKIPSPVALRVPILVYHSVLPYRIGETYEQDAYDITPELFENHLKYLKDNGYTTISPDQLAKNFTVGTTSPVQKPVILTFDDGWKNQYIYAYPLLKKYGMTATFYVYTHSLGYKPFLTWWDIKEMMVNGMTIGSHTVSHPYFKISSDEKLRYEITESKKILEKELGAIVNNFASPFGYVNDHIVEITKEAGYTTGRTIYRGVYQEDVFLLRGNLVSDSMDDFRKILNEKRVK